MEKRARPVSVVLLLLVASLGVTGCGRLSAQVPENVPPSLTGTGIPFEPLATSEWWEYQGAFRLSGTANGTSFAYGGEALGFRPATETTPESLFVNSHVQHQKVAEVSIPTPAIAATYAALPVATVIQTFQDAFDGTRTTIDGDTGNGVRAGGYLPWGVELIATAFSYYDAGTPTQTKAYWRSGIDLSNPVDAVGPFATTADRGGYISGPLTETPTRWIAPLGGPALSTHIPLPIVSRASWGHVLHAFDPANVGVVTPLPMTKLLAFPSNHVLEPFSGSGQPAQWWNAVTGSSGVILPEESRSALFIGRRGDTAPCYGVGSPQNPPPSGQCYDPTSIYSGFHGYPYKFFVVAYDAVDFVRVRDGLKQSWEPRPYATWEFELPFANAGRRVAGVAVDWRTGRVFITTNYGTNPIVHVIKVRKPPTP